MRTLKYSILVVCLLAGSLLFKGCQDLNVNNPNEPTREAVLGDVDNTLKLLRGGFQTATHAAVSEWAVHMQFLSDQSTTTNAFRSFWDFSEQPRLAINNTTAYSAEAAISTFWGDFNSAIATANQFIRLIEEEGQTFTQDGNDLTKQIQSQAYFLRGFSRGYLGIIYDQAYLLDSSFDPTSGDTPDLQPYGTLVDNAITDIERAKKLAREFDSSGSVDFTFNSMPNTGDSWSAAQYYDILNSMAARFLAGKARTPSERDGLDWARIEAYADSALGGSQAASGLTDWTASNVGSSGEYANDLADWENFVVTCDETLGSCAGYNPVDVKQIHLLDPSYPVNYPASEASSGNAGLGPASSSDPRLDYFVYTTNPGFLDPNRNPNLFTNYFSLRYFANSNWWPNSFGVTLITSVEVDLLKAEAQLMQGNAPGAAITLNNTTAGNTPMPNLSIELPVVQLGFATASSMYQSGGHSLAGTESTARFQWALLREYSVELSLMGGGGLQWYFMRRHDLLQPGTPLHYPVPGEELELTGRDNYTFGGASNAGSEGTAAGNNEWRELANDAFGTTPKASENSAKMHTPLMGTDIKAPQETTKGAIEK